MIPPRIMANSKTTTTNGVKHNSNLTAVVLEGFVLHVQSALNVLYGAKVASGADNDFGSVAFALEGFKDAAADRAKTIRLEASKPVICPRCSTLPVKDNGLCVSCLYATQETAKPAAAVKPIVTAPTFVMPATDKARRQLCKDNGLSVNGSEDAVRERLTKHFATPKTAPAAAAQIVTAPAPKVTVAAQSPTLPTKPVETPKASAPVVATQTVKPVAPKVESKPLPTSYKALMSLGSDTVLALATQLNVNADGLNYGKLCGAVWTAVKTATPPSKPITVEKTVTISGPKVETATPIGAGLKAGTIVICDGRGGYTIATAEQLWAALDSLTASI